MNAPKNIITDTLIESAVVAACCISIISCVGLAAYFAALVLGLVGA